MEEYNTGDKQSPLQKVNKELADVQKMLAEDFEKMIDRDNNLSKMGQRAADLKTKSSEFKDRSTHLKWNMMMRNYVFIGIGVGIIGVILYFLLA